MALKAKELMVDDWVYYKQPNGYFKINFTAMRNLCWDEDNGMSKHNIEPIPLTKEILKANSFKLEVNDYVWTDGKHSPEQVYVAISFRRDGTVRIVDVHNFRCQFFNDRLTNEYTVHELQHALRLCGFNALADNFKIE